jgi:glycosyltransferase involved in cell wall biosynthesis
VPGAAAAAFVSELAPGLPCVQAPNAVNMPVNRVIREPLPPWSAIFVGELSRRKGFDVVLESIPDLLSDFAAVVVAGAGPMKHQIEALAGRDPRIRYLGFEEGQPSSQQSMQPAWCSCPAGRTHGRSSRPKPSPPAVP